MKKTKDSCDVASCFLCKCCLADWLPLVELNRKNLRFKKGETIFEEGRTVEGIYFLYKGRVKVHKQWGAGKELIIRFATDGEILGHRGLGDNCTYPVSATALEPTTICFIDTAFFLSTLKINQGLAFKLVMLYAKELQATEQRMHDLVNMDMKGRIAGSLLMLKNQFGIDANNRLNINISRQDLASFAGTTYETVFRILNELVTAKCIVTEDKNIKVVDETLLVSFTKA